MDIKRVVVRAVAVGAALCAMATSIVVARSAFAGEERCFEPWFCMWEDKDFDAQINAIQGDWSYFGDKNNDKMTSFWNRSPHTYSVFDNAGYGGCLAVIPPGGKSRAMWPQTNDRASAARIGTAGCEFMQYDPGYYPYNG